jgi:hypothetical protein
VSLIGIVVYVNGNRAKVVRKGQLHDKIDAYMLLRSVVEHSIHSIFYSVFLLFLPTLFSPLKAILAFAQPKHPFSILPCMHFFPSF